MATPPTRTGKLPGNTMNRLLHIATLTNNLPQYQAMRASMELAGYSESTCRFTLFDNSQSNQHEPFEVLRLLEHDGDEPFIVLCHQDLLFSDSSSFTVLKAQITLLNERFPDWALAGTAGISWRGFPVMHLDDPYGSHRDANPPRQVISLDENFLLLRRDRFIRPSPGLTGFHFYGTDLVLRALQQRRRAYVIQLPIRHLSAGVTSGKIYKDSRTAMMQTWRPQLWVGLVQSLPSQFRVSRLRWLEWVLQFRLSASVLRRLRLPIIVAHPGSKGEIQ